MRDQPEAAPGAVSDMNQFENVQKFGKDGVEAASKALGAYSRNAQVIAVETADYAKRSFEQGTSAMERLLSAKTLDKAVEVQAEYLKASYEGFVAQSTKMGEIYATLAREMFAPFTRFAPASAPRA